MTIGSNDMSGPNAVGEFERPIWETLGPGRELDALVAERVMGWKSDRGVVWQAPGDGGFWRLRDDHDGLPFYSTNMAGAWSVVQQLQRLGRRVDITAYRARADGMVPVQLEILSTEHPTVRVRHDYNMPALICVAALAAVMDANHKHETRGGM